MTPPCPEDLEPPLAQIRTAPGAVSETLRFRAAEEHTFRCNGLPVHLIVERAANLRWEITRFGTNGGTVRVLFQTPSAPNVLPENESHLEAKPVVDLDQHDTLRLTPAKQSVN
jgi:hypothetical protein